MPDIKKCSKCNEDRPKTDFHKDKHNSDGLTSACKWCRGSKNHAFFRNTDKPLCRTCGKVKTRDDFYKRSNRKSGLQHRCKSCVDEYSKQPNVKERAQYNSWKSHLSKNYGITPDDYFKMYNEQKGCCKICGTDTPCTTRRNNRFFIDHCHKTGKIRGLLCNTCNRGIGLLKDSSEILARASEYLKNN